ncbi:hypothetical protein V9K67_23335 [Paraflavisolibacter sp. H34]|uniref:hypothetical protein n=1 Tax=Huijunlia imazamoxiresistens TaxID=3127457 RepID=UPI003018599A
MMVLVNIITDAVERGWDNFLARPKGPLNFRFILQTLMATSLAIRAGIKDARAGQPPFLWTVFSDRARRRQLKRSGWKDVQRLFFLACLLDAIYQLIVHQGIFLFELLFTATLLAVLPYILLRGPANRVARGFIRRHPGAVEKEPLTSPPLSNDND